MESMGMGGCVISKNIIDGKANIKWCIRETFLNDLDNGWRILSDIDTDEFLSNPANMVVCDWGTVVTIEPAIMSIFDLPIGTDITLVIDGNIKRFVYTETGIEV